MDEGGGGSPFPQQNPLEEGNGGTPCPIRDKGSGSGHFQTWSTQGWDFTEKAPLSVVIQPNLYRITLLG